MEELGWWWWSEEEAVEEGEPRWMLKSMGTERWSEEINEGSSSLTVVVNYAI